MSGVGTKPWVTQTTKEAKCSVVRESSKKMFICRSGHVVDEVNSSGKGIGQIGEW